MNIPILAITMCDPASIGPEITVKALAQSEIHRICRPLVVGKARKPGVRTAREETLKRRSPTGDRLLFREIITYLARFSI